MLPEFITDLPPGHSVTPKLQRTGKLRHPGKTKIKNKNESGFLEDVAAPIRCTNSHQKLPRPRLCSEESGSLPGSGSPGQNFSQISPLHVLSAHSRRPRSGNRSPIPRYTVEIH